MTVKELPDPIIGDVWAYEDAGFVVNATWSGLNYSEVLLVRRYNDCLLHTRNDSILARGKLLRCWITEASVEAEIWFDNEVLGKVIASAQKLDAE